MAVECSFLFVEAVQADLLYAALVTGDNNTHLNGEIKSFVGKHKTWKTNFDVIKLQISKCTLVCFPQSINSTFLQLTQLMVTNCGLKEISRKNLIGFEKLTVLSLSGNQITTLHKDLLVDMPCLDTISFTNNKLKYVDSQMLTIIKNKWRRVLFRSNPTIDEYYFADNPDGSLSLTQLIAAIDSKCKKPHLQLDASADFLVQGHKKLWETGALADFIIRASLTEFNVHKAILAAGSPVFAAMFATDMKERQDRRMVIKDFSANDVKDFLQFFYFGSVTNSINPVENFKLAEKYHVIDLKYICESLLLDTIQENNVIEFLELGTLYNLQVLKNEAFRIIKLALPGRNVLDHWINEPDRLKEIMEAKMHLDALFTETKNY